MLPVWLHEVYQADLLTVYNTRGQQALRVTSAMMSCRLIPSSYAPLALLSLWFQSES